MLVDETHIIDTYLIVLYCVAALLESGFLSVEFCVAIKAHHDAVFGAGCVVECEVCFVVQTCFTNWAETKLVLVPSCFFFLFRGEGGDEGDGFRVDPFTLFFAEPAPWLVCGASCVECVANVRRVSAAGTVGFKGREVVRVVRRDEAFHAIVVASVFLGGVFFVLLLL